MNRNDLNPTVITDKNGKITTVHKRASATSKSAALPSPHIQSQQRINELHDRVAEALYPTHGRQDPMKVKGFLRKMDDMAEAFVQLVEKASNDDKTDKDYARANLSFLVLAIVDSDGGLRKNVLKYHDVFPENLTLTDARFIIKKITETIGPDDSSDGYREKVRAHLYAAANYQRHDDKDYEKFDYEDNDDLFNLVTRRPDDVEEIMRLHNEYKVPIITDETIEEYRNHHTSLGHGIL